MSDFRRRIERGTPRLWAELCRLARRNPPVLIGLAVLAVFSFPVALAGAIVSAYLLGADA